MVFEEEMPPMPTKPAPFPEMKMVEPMTGTWTGSGEMVEPCPDEIRAMMPESERANFKSTFAGGSTSKFELEGAVLRSEGWFEMPADQKGSYLEYWTWDPREGKFRTWFSSDWSETGAGWATPSKDGRCFHVKGSSYDAMCNKKKFEGCMCIRDNDTLEWDFTERGPMGRFRMRGMSNRQK
jgi:hypothetical protein